MGITERTDILVDFSPFAPGTQIILRNTTSRDGDEAPGDVQVMRFTVVDSTPVPPPALDPGLFPPRPTLLTNAPTRIKTLIRFREPARDQDQPQALDRRPGLHLADHRVSAGRLDRAVGPRPHERGRATEPTTGPT